MKLFIQLVLYMHFAKNMPLIFTQTGCYRFVSLFVFISFFVSKKRKNKNTLWLVVAVTPNGMCFRLIDHFEFTSSFFLCMYINFLCIEHLFFYQSLGHILSKAAEACNFKRFMRPFKFPLSISICFSPFSFL